MTDARRLQNSAAFSVSFHVALFGLYFLMKATQSAPELLISSVELIDMNPQPEVPAGPPPGEERAPQGALDFLRMALPRFKPSGPAESAPMEAPVEALQRPPEMLGPRPTLVDKGALARGPQIDLKTTDAPRSAASFSDLSAPADPSAVAALADLEAEPTIDLDAVGRRAVPSSAGPSISLDRSGPAPRASRLAEAASPSAVRPASASQGGASAGIRMVDDGPVRRVARVSSAGPAVGYGGGSGISLGGRRAARPAGIKMPEPAAAAPVREEPKIQPVSGKDKGVEIIGPLASRKVLKPALPQYPAWAKERGVEAETVIRFFVSAEGKVRDRMILERTSGYQELDDLCMKALKKWLFAALPQERMKEGDQWGIITFRFRLK